MQSETFFRTMTNRLVTFFESSVVPGAKWLFSSSQGRAVLKHSANALGIPVTAESVTAATQQAVSKAVTPLMDPVPALIICREIQMIYQVIRDANRQRREGNICREEFIKITIKRVAEGCGSVAGVGVALAMPVTRNFIGCTLASVIGQGAGAVVGRAVGHMYSRRAQ